MGTQMIIRLDTETKLKLTKLAQAEGKNTSQIVRELISNYIQERDMGAYIDDLWQRMGNKMRNQKIGASEIDHAVRDVRLSKK